MRIVRSARVVAALLTMGCVLWAAALQAQPAPIAGELAVREALHDPQFGMSARVPGLRRVVEMWQWQEQRDAQGARSYAPIWSEQLIDSRAFAGDGEHVNPALPFASAQWWAASAMLNGHAVAPELLATLDGWQHLPADARVLPENLAAVFRAQDGFLYSGEDPQQPRIGDLRVHWQVLPPGPVHGLARVEDHALSADAEAVLVRGVASGNELPGLAQGARPGSDLLLWLQAAAALSVLLLLVLLWRRGRGRRR